MRVSEPPGKGAGRPAGPARLQADGQCVKRSCGLQNLPLGLQASLPASKLAGQQASKPNSQSTCDRMS